MKTNPYDALPKAPAFSVTSQDVNDGAALAAAHRSGVFGAGGEDVSPQLAWSGAPAGTKSYAVTVFDPDAPSPSGFWHWAVFNIPASVTALPRDAGTPNGNGLPAGAAQLPNDARLAQFIGAAPPAGHGPHRYFFVVHALDVDSLSIPEGATPGYLSFLMFGHTLGRATLVATSETP